MLAKRIPLLLLLFFSIFYAQEDCPNPPTIEFLMVDACGPPEAPNEFAIINSGDGFEVDDFQFTFNPTNTGFGSWNSNVNIGFDSACGLTSGNADLYTGCDHIFSAGPGDEIPPNSYVVFQTSADADATYDFSNLCTDDKCIYVIANSCERTQGAFTNKQTASPGPRQNFVSIAGTSCFHEATYNTEDLISNANGNYFIPPDEYGITPGSPCQVPSLPDLEAPLPSFDIPLEICAIEAVDFELPNLSEEGVMGSWSPDFDSQNSQAYTFTPNDGECYDELTIELTILQTSIPEFSFSTTLCEDESFELPNFSDNGIEGEWSPSIIDNTITDYNFTPAEDECAEEISISLEFLPVEEPEFSLEENICQGDDFDFPEISDNNIPGNWTPEFDDQNSATYTFTPENDCFPEFSFDLEVEENLTLEFDLPDQICFGEVVDLPTTSANGIEGTWEPEFDLNNTTTYTFTPSTQICEVEIFQQTIEVVDFELDLSTDLLEVCSISNDPLTGEFDLGALASEINFQNLDLNIDFYSNEEDADAAENPLELIYSTTSNESIWIRIDDNNSDCFTIETLDLMTYSTPETQTPTDFEECALSAEEVQQFFDLTEVEAEVLADIENPNELQIDYYIDEDSAINEVEENLIITPTNYLSQTNAQNIEDVVYIRVTDPNSPLRCFSIEPIQLRINPITPINPPSLLAVCKDDTSGVEGQFASFDLTSKINEITNNAPSLEVSFFETEDDLNSNNPIENPSDYTNIENPQNIFVNVQSSSLTCDATTNLTLVVSPNPSIPLPDDLIECATNEEGFAFFDLASEIDQILANEVDAEISFHETESDAFDNSNPISIEDENGNSILYENQNSNQQTLYIRASSVGNSNQLETDCFVVRPIELIVEPRPEIQDLADLNACDDGSNNGFTNFDLTQNNQLILGGQNPEELEITYHFTEENAIAGIQQIAVPQNFTNFVNPQEIFVRISSSENNCSNISSFFVRVNEKPSIELTADNEYVCADTSDAQGENNDFTTFDLTTKDEEINPNFGDGETEVRYYSSQEALENGEFISNPSTFENTENPQLIFAEVINLTNECSSLTKVEFELHVHPLPLVDLGNMDGATICVDPITGELTQPDELPILDTGLEDTEYEFVWLLNGNELENETNSFLVVIEPGVYEVEIIDTSFSTRTECFTTSQAEIIESSAPIFKVQVLSSPFEGNHQIEIINISGIGDFEFSVDGAPWIPLQNQESLVIEGLESGEVQVIGRDINGCGTSTEFVTLIDYPKFFTPNNDGFNDTWNIIGLEQSDAKVFIFDRYGKLLKQIDPSGEGWNGTYNGKPMPSNDYWFKVEYTNPRTGARKTFKSNFTLKR